MTAAVYIVSPSDKVDAFASQARSVEYDGMKILVGNAEHDVRSVVFADGSPGELKKKLASGEVPNKEWKVLKERVVSMLKAVRVGSENFRLFVHFGGQGEDEVNKFNKALGLLAADGETWCCYAISFGNKMPSELFPNGEFLPPVGEKFFAMCQNMHGGKIEGFEHVRALRMLLSCAVPDQDGQYDISAIDNRFLEICGAKTMNEALSDGEMEFVKVNPLPCKLFHVDNIAAKVKRTKVLIARQDFGQLLKILQREEPNREQKQ